MILEQIFVFTFSMVTSFGYNNTRNDTEDASLTTTTFVPVESGLEEEIEMVGFILGDPCDEHCSENLSHAICNHTTKMCECESSYPIPLNSLACIAPLHLGELCNYEESCAYYDHNAMCSEESPYFSKCACKKQYHIVENEDGVQKCVENAYVPHYDMPTFFGLGVGLSLFSGMTCLVLRLFSKARFGEPRGHYANANASPPIMMTGMSTPTSAPPSRRSSGRSSGTPGSRRPSYYMLAAPSRPGSRRPSVASIRSQTSTRSGGRYERGHHEALRSTMSAPINDFHSPTGSINNFRLLEQKFAQYGGGYSRQAAEDRIHDRESSRHNSQEIITDVISESPEKA